MEANIIGFYLNERYIVLSDGNRRINWPNGDDKRPAPECVRTEDDFLEIVNLIADTVRLKVVDYVERPYGPAYRLGRRL